jgi:hypothetical protein
MDYVIGDQDMLLCGGQGYKTLELYTDVVVCSDDGKNCGRIDFYPWYITKTAKIPIKNESPSANSNG